MRRMSTKTNTIANSRKSTDIFQKSHDAVEWATCSLSPLRSMAVGGRLETNRLLKRIQNIPIPLSRRCRCFLISLATSENQRIEVITSFNTTIYPKVVDTV